MTPATSVLTIVGIFGFGIASDPVLHQRRTVRGSGTG
jgi:hypothetical protein